MSPGVQTFIEITARAFVALLGLGGMAATLAGAWSLAKWAWKG
jgi:hypothetical protein